MINLTEQLIYKEEGFRKRIVFFISFGFFCISLTQTAFTTKDGISIIRQPAIHILAMGFFDLLAFHTAWLANPILLISYIALFREKNRPCSWVLLDCCVLYHFYITTGYLQMKAERKVKLSLTDWAIGCGS
ncbi:hypothetical protein SAMN04487935_0687 [Flavobacterium noncentrifugens]|uniref:Uncharacterized protein n=1 Tax=Flavobacterium noncentrifugens TaxID=1128970 RepID=A0A1G8SSY5_9FLAO|nr:hypothetical protein SAMN04487935_0687 [Flavobacterium noncentrifugens]